MLEATQPVRGRDEIIPSELLHYIMIVSQEYLEPYTSNNNIKSLMHYRQKETTVTYTFSMNACFSKLGLSSKQSSDY